MKKKLILIFNKVINFTKWIKRGRPLWGLHTRIWASPPGPGSGLPSNTLHCVSQEGHSGLLLLSRVTHSANSYALVISPAAFCGPCNSRLGWAGRDRLLWAVFHSTALCLSLSASPATTLFFGRHAFDGLSTPHVSTLQAAFGETAAPRGFSWHRTIPS